MVESIRTVFLFSTHFRLHEPQRHRKYSRGKLNRSFVPGTAQGFVIFYSQFIPPAVCPTGFHLQFGYRLLERQRYWKGHSFMSWHTISAGILTIASKGRPQAGAF